MIFTLRNNILKLEILIFLIYYLYKNRNNKIFGIVKNKLLINKNNIKIYSLYDFLNTNRTENNSFLIFEPNTYHHECTPGYSKYFIDIGFNVDIVMHSSGKDSFCLFKRYDNIKLFIFDDIKEINSQLNRITYIIKKYKFVLLQTTKFSNYNLTSKLKLFNISNSFFIIHNITITDMSFINYIEQNSGLNIVY